MNNKHHRQLMIKINTKKTHLLNLRLIVTQSNVQ